MKRRPVHFAAAIAELLRFFALMVLAQELGLFRASNGAVRLFRYAAAPQLLFAAGFFFLWLDRRRYDVYRPLLIVGKLALLAALLPLALLVGDFFRAAPSMIGNPVAVMALLSFVALVDLAVLALLAFSGSPGQIRAAGTELPGQGPGDIEKVEG